MIFRYGFDAKVTDKGLISIQKLRFENDTLYGGAGDDQLTGGAGSDTFVFAGAYGRDDIQDFGTEDHLDLSGIDTIEDYADLIAGHLWQTAAGVWIGDWNQNTITLRGWDIDDLSEELFLF